MTKAVSVELRSLPGRSLSLFRRCHQMPSASWSTILSEAYLFPVFQGLVVLTRGIAVLMKLMARFRAGFGVTQLTVTRSQTSMVIYYGTYAAVVACLSRYA